MVKDYEIDPNCNLEKYPDNSKPIAREYGKLKITKCSVEEFGKRENEKVLDAIESQYILMIKTLNKSIDEAVNFAINELKKLNGDLLKCLLNQIYDR